MPGAIRNIRWHGNSKEFAFNLVSNGTPGDIYSVNIETCKVDRWTKVGISGLDLTKNAKPELIKWKSFDQREVSGWLYRPSAKFAGKRPVIINIHGGPEFQFRPEFLGVKNYFINELGIAMVFPNVRGSSGYGKTFMTLDDGPRREDAYRDIETLLDWIERDPSLDSSRIMIQGQSYGGHMTFALATRLGKRVACFNAVSGVSNLATISTETTPELGEVFRLEFGDVRNPETKAFLERISPINNAESIQSPMLIVHGKNDPRVRVAESDTMVAAIKRHGTPVWYLRASNEGHGFHHEENVRYSLIATISFVKTYLLNRPSPSTTQPTGAHFVDPNPRLSHWESGLDNDLQTPLGHRLWSNG